MPNELKDLQREVSYINLILVLFHGYSDMREPPRLEKNQEYT